MQTLARNLQQRLNLLQFLSQNDLNDPSSLRQLLNQIANDEFDLKNINTGNFKIQIKCSIGYTNIVKKLKPETLNSISTNRSRKEALK